MARRLIPVNGWTPTQKRILDVLADGQHHTRDELLRCLEDSEADLNAMQQHLTRMREKLRHLNVDILCTLHKRRICYRQVRLMPAE